MLCKRLQISQSAGICNDSERVHKVGLMKIDKAFAIPRKVIDILLCAITFQLMRCMLIFFLSAQPFRSSGDTPVLEVSS